MIIAHAPKSIAHHHGPSILSSFTGARLRASDGVMTESREAILARKAPTADYEPYLGSEVAWPYSCRIPSSVAGSGALVVSLLTAEPAAQVTCGDGGHAAGGDITQAGHQ
jgi:hypothetical protein